ncbi:MAG: polysaccharide biosynthesis protein [Clostridioides sp.]|nr:polysaccharide biosynthesis protein [Clostridioides sp.]
MLIGVDIICVAVSFALSYILVTDLGRTVDSYELKSMIFPLIIYLVLNLMAFSSLKCYSTLWRYAGEEGIVSIFLAIVLYLVPVFAVHRICGYNFDILFYVLNTVFIMASTLSYRIIYSAVLAKINRKSANGDISKVLIIGAGDAGEMVIHELKRNPALGKTTVAIVDDDLNKVGRIIHGVKIVDTTARILDVVEKYEIDEIIFSIANIEHQRKRNILDICKNTNCKIQTIPGIYEIIDGKVHINQIRDVRIEDLLGREEVDVDFEKFANYIEGKNVIVTGGGGSIGSELCSQIANFNPSALIILDNYENNAYDIQQKLIRKHGDSLNLKVVIASVREIKRLDEIFNEYRPQIVFHAAAHKHVPLMEFNPGEAIKNNIFGTLNTARTASKYGAERFVLISTDKAVNPTNIMGATKRAAEMIIQTMNEQSDTEFVAVRFGNVLGSNGSVIPLLKKQIEEGGPVTVTHPMIIRYFMTIPEAVGLVIQAGAMAKGGEIFVLDMGEPVKILDLATNLIKFSGLEPDVDIKIEFTGLRPGEKLYEELLMAEEGLISTEHKKIFIGKPIEIDIDRTVELLDDLKAVVEEEEISKIEGLMKQLVTTYISVDVANAKRG